MSILRLIVDPPTAGARNMAVDETLLEAAAERNEATLRVYGWSTPTLSLGYFQGLDERASHVASLRCPVVRRRSGGGAILHDREITYSLSLPVARLASRQPEYLYQTVHQAWITAILRVCAIQVSLAGCDQTCVDQPFLCFQRRAAFDLVVQDDKILGSAQRRHRTAVLQHGSLLLNRSRHAPELPGLADFASTSWDAESLIEAWYGQLVAQLEMQLKPALLAEHERTRVDYLVQTRYASENWTSRR